MSTGSAKQHGADGGRGSSATSQQENLSLLGLAKSTKQHTPLSGIFLILGLAFFLFSSTAMILLVGAKTGGATMSWGVAFLPIWVGDGLTVVCLVGAMISACCAIVQDHSTGGGGDGGDDHDEEDASSVLQKNREAVAQGPTHVNHIKHVLTSGFCCPFIFLPPLPVLGLLLGFHVNIWRYMNGNVSVFLFFHFLFVCFFLEFIYLNPNDSTL